MDHRLPYISLDECKVGFLYEVDARNFSLGIFNKYLDFIGIRYKMGMKYLDYERHYDIDVRYGTVKPLKEIEYFKNPDDSNYDEIFKYLDKRIKEYEERE